ncbi:hypothetical protein BH11ACT2_BH11ACT2_15340 [soil metagenome]
MTDQLQRPAAHPADDLRAPAPNFSVREYARTAVASHRADLDLDAFEAQPLSVDTLRVLAYAQAVEHATMNHLRNLLVTPTHKDARVTAFLTTWAFEKYWIADAIGAVLSRHNLVAVQAQAVRHKVTAQLRAMIDRLSPIRESLVANHLGVDVIASHMAIGSIDTWLSQAAYKRITELEPHPELTKILDRIRSIKDRHLEFFLPQAEFRLAESPKAQVISARRLKREPMPTGSNEQPHSETSFFFTHLFSTATHFLDEIDARIDALPGQNGLSLMRRRFKAYS